MTKQQVWCNVKKDQIPNNCQLIGSEWVFKKKGNSVYRGSLCRLGYAQVPDSTTPKNSSPVVLEDTLCIILILMIKYR